MAGDSSAEEATRPLITKRIKSREQAQGHGASSQDGRGPAEVDEDDSSGGCSEDEVHLSRPWKKFSKCARFLQEGFQLQDALRTPPFCFKKRQARIDWRTLHAINVDSLIQEIDICKLETVLDTITYGDIQGEDTRNFTEQNFIKLFRLGQLMIEYLLHVQAVLAEHKSQLLSAGASAQRKGEKLRLRYLWQRDALKQSQTDLKHAKKTLKTYEILLRSSGKQTALHQVHHCPCCDKVFESGYYLDLHVSRRHQSSERAPAEKQAAQEERHAALIARTERTDGRRALEQVKAETDAALQAQFERLHHIPHKGSQSSASAAITSLQRALRDSNHRLDLAEQQLERLQSEVPVSTGSRQRAGQCDDENGRHLRTLEHRFEGVEEQLQRLHKENIKLKTELDGAYRELVTLRSGKHRSTSNDARISPARGRTSNPSRKDPGASFEALEHASNAKAVEDWISETDERFGELSTGPEDSIEERSHHSTNGAKPSPSSIARQLAETDGQSITSDKCQWLKEHQHAPITEMPYALSKYPHGQSSIATMQEKLSENFNERLNLELKKFGISGNAAGISDQLFSAAMSALERQRMNRYRESALNDRRIMEYERSTIQWHIERAVKSRDLDIMESIFEEETDSESGSAPSQLSDEEHESPPSALRTSPSGLRTSPASVEPSPSYSQHLPLLSTPRECRPPPKQRGVTGQVIAQRVKSPTNEVQHSILISPVSSPQAAAQVDEEDLGLGDWDSDDSNRSSKSPDIQRQVMRDIQSGLRSPVGEQAGSKTIAKQKGKQQLATGSKQRAASCNLSDDIKMLDDLDAEINELIQ